VDIIEAVLAFALLMVAFSTVASGLTETVNRLLALRKLNLRIALRKFLHDIVWPNYVSAVRAKGGNVDGASRRRTLETLLDTLTRNMVAESNLWTPTGFGYYWTSRLWVDELSPEAFMERLAKTEVGQATLRLDEADRRATIADFTLSYERYMAASQELYRKTARQIAFVVAIVLAIAANIHLGRLVVYLRDNPEAVQEIVSNEEEIVRIYETLQASAGEDVDDEALEQIALEIEETRAALETVRVDYNLPIGWQYWPYGDDEVIALEPGDTTPPVASGLPDYPKRFLAWLAQVILAGILIGLGAPFWYQIVRKVGQSRAIGASLGLSRPESVGRGENVHDQSALERAEINDALFVASGQADGARGTGRVDDTPAPLG